MTPAHYGLVAAATLAALSATRTASAHCVVGDRTIPMTLAIDTPCVVDDFMPMAMGTKNGDHTREIDVPLQFSKRITEKFGVTLAATWARMWMPDNLSTMIMPMDMPMDMAGMTPMPMLMPMPMYMPAMNMSGWQNLQTTFKYQLVTESKAEFVLSAGLTVDWGGVGNRSVGAPRFTTLIPTLWFGKGFGDFPEAWGWARAFALTGQFGLRAPTWSRTSAISDSGMSPAGADMSGMIGSVMDMSCMNMPTPFTFGMNMNMTSVNDCRHPATFVYGASLQYNFSYLKRLGIDLNLPSFMNQLTPLVEAQFRTPLANTLTRSVPPYYGVELAPNLRPFSSSTTAAATVGTINPGLIWAGDSFQIGAEAIIPINRQSGRGLGWMVSIDFYLHRLFPDSLGRPLLSLADESDGDHEHDHHGNGPAHDHRSPDGGQREQAQDRAPAGAQAGQTHGDAHAH